VLTKDVLKLDETAEIERIGNRLRESLSHVLRKRGLVIAMSSGIDSSVSAALAVRALGPDKVFGLLLPERDSSPQSARNAETLAKHLGIRYQIEDIAPTLEAIGCYRWRDEAIRRALPEYSTGWKSKIIISGGLEGRINHFKLVAHDPKGAVHEVRLELAVVGTPNRLEFDQGFFVKNGDGAADVKPIAHLYKSQVYALARFLKLPDVICNAIPTTDTYSLPQGQDEFYFALPYQQMDVALWALNHGVDSRELATFLGIAPERAEHVYADILAKRRTTSYLHARPVLMEDVPEIRA
jgi:NAD+ synthase